MSTPVGRRCGSEHERSPRAGILTLFVVMASVMGFALPGPLVAEDADAAPNPIPILSLTLFPPQLRATVTQSQLGAVTFHGNATVEKMTYFERVTVTLQAVVNTGWPVVMTLDHFITARISDRQIPPFLNIFGGSMVTSNTVEPLPPCSGPASRIRSMFSIIS